jgi:hypothetical protein
MVVCPTLKRVQVAVIAAESRINTLELNAQSVTEMCDELDRLPPQDAVQLYRKLIMSITRHWR